MSDGREVLVYLEDLRTEARRKVRKTEIAAALKWIEPRTAELAKLFEELQT